VLLSVFTATDEMVGPVRQAKAEIETFTHDLLARRAAQPGDDITSALVAATDAGQLADGDAYFLLEELLSASVDNTANAAALALYTLAQRPDAWRSLHNNPGCIDAAIEECGRFEPAIRHTIKAAVAPTTVGGVDVQPGEFVTVRIAAAHRDPLVYDSPHTFSLDRIRPKPQLSFGAGRHYCVGAALGKMEVTEMVRGMTSRWTNAEVRDGVDMDLNLSGVVRRLPIGLTQ
jgi:cytochrome P450